MMAKDKKILVLGAAVVDVILRIERLPRPGEDIPGEAQGMIVGGCAFNVSKILDALGTPHDLCIPVGKGLYADQIRRALDAAGRTSMIEEEGGDNGYCLSLVEADGERTFITVDGIEAAWCAAWLASVDVAQYDYICVNGYSFPEEGTSGDVLMDALRKKREDAWLVLDPGPRLVGARFRKELLEMRTMLEMNASEARAMSGKDDVYAAAEALHKETKEPVIVTMRKQGTLCCTEAGTELVPAEPVKPLDTIGAGDSHTAGFLSALARGASLVDACREANRVASIVVRHVGCSMK